jgi:uncharacterized membrane protein
MIELTNIHPMLVHFPIALLILGFLAEVAGLVLKRQFFTDAALLLLVTGALGAVAAVLSGSYAAGGLEEAGSLKQAVETHEGAAELAMWLGLVAAGFRTALFFAKKYTGSLRYVALFLFLIAVLAVARAGYYGGELVFKHAAGVTFQIG